MSDTERTTEAQLRANVQSTAEDLDRLISIAQSDDDEDEGMTLPDVWRFLESHGASHDEDDDPAETAQTLLEEWPLEGYVTGRRDFSSGDWTPNGVVIVFGTGGPHIELDTTERAICGYWGGDTARYGVSTRVLQWAEEFAGVEL